MYAYIHIYPLYIVVVFNLIAINLAWHARLVGFRLIAENWYEWLVELACKAWMVLNKGPFANKKMLNVQNYSVRHRGCDAMPPQITDLLCISYIPGHKHTQLVCCLKHVKRRFYLVRTWANDV